MLRARGVVSGAVAFAGPGEVFGLAEGRGDLLVGAEGGALRRVPAGPAGSVFVFDPAAPAGGAVTEAPAFAGEVGARGFFAAGGRFAAAGDLVLAPGPGGRARLAGGDELVGRGELAAALPRPAPDAGAFVTLLSGEFEAAPAAPGVAAFAVPAGRVFFATAAVAFCSTFAPPARGAAGPTIGLGSAAARRGGGATDAAGPLALSVPARRGAGDVKALWPAGPAPARVFALEAGPVYVNVLAAGAGLAGVRFRAGFTGFFA